MNKRNILVLLLLALVLTIVLSGCRKAEFSVSINEDRTAEINAKNAGTDMFSGAGGFIVEEGQKIHVEPSLNKGEINLKFSTSDLGIDANVKDLMSAASGDNAVLEVKINGKEPSDHEIEPGDYYVYAQVLSKAEGTILITAR